MYQFEQQVSPDDAASGPNEHQVRPSVRERLMKRQCNYTFAVVHLYRLFDVRSTVVQLFASAGDSRRETHKQNGQEC